MQSALNGEILRDWCKGSLLAVGQCERGCGLPATD